MSTPERLLQILKNKGSLAPGSPWAAAVAQVPRELFLPDRFEAGGHVVDRATHPMGSWATAEHVPGQASYEVEQYGPRRLWDEVEAAYRQWERYGRPERERAGMTVHPGGQDLWLDEPGKPIAVVHRPGP
ncbi:hypothetical protein ACFQ6V_10550 [Streptomyces roseifaciens]